MNDAYFRDKLSAYLDNQLPPDERLIVEQYIADHPEAQKELERLRDFSAMVEKQAALRDDLYWEKSAQRIEQAIGIGKAKTPVETAQGWRWTPFRVSSLVATAASIALIAYIGLRDRDHIEQRVQDKFNTPNEKSVQDQAMKQTEPAPSVVDSSAAISVDSFTASSSKKQSAAPVQAPSPKLQTTDKRPQLATDKDSGAKSLAQQSAPVEALAKRDEEVVVPPPAAMKSAEREEQKKELAESPMASAEVAVQDEATQPVTSGVTKLIQQRDSLYALLAKQKSGIGATNSLTERKKPALFKSTVNPNADKATLLSIWYQLAHQTADSTVQKQSRDSLTAYSTGSDEQLRKLAQGYLDSLSTSKPDSGR